MSSVRRTFFRRLGNSRQNEDGDLSRTLFPKQFDACSNRRTGREDVIDEQNLRAGYSFSINQTDVFSDLLSLGFTLAALLDVVGLRKGVENGQSKT